MSYLHIFGGFSSSEKSIIESLKTHAQLSVKASEKLQTLVSEIAADNWQHARDIYLEIDRVESTADEVHKDIVEELSTGVFFSGLGVDLMNLAEKIDGVADSAKDAARILIYRKINGKEISPILELLLNYLITLTKAAVSLKIAIEALKHDRKEIMKRAMETEQYEEAADEIKNELMEQVYELQLPVLSILQLKDFIITADNIGDNSEDAGDILYVLLAKGYA